MAQPTIGTKVKLDGEKEYRAALAQINAALKQLGAEMRGTAQDFADNEDSVEALTATNDVLTRQIETQKEKIATLQEVLQKSGEAYGEADKRTIDWKTSLINAETELKKMQKALDENNEALDEASEGGSAFSQALGKVKDALAKTKDEGTGAKGLLDNLKEAFAGGEQEAVGLGDAIGGAADRLGINLPGGAEKAFNSLNSVSAGTAACVAGFAAVAAAIVAAEKKLISITKESAEYAKELKTLSSVTGQSTQEIQELRYASDMIGVSYDRIKDSLKEVTNKMQEAQNGSEDTAAAFEKLGVNIENSDGSLRDANDVFYDTIDALGRVQNQTERDAIAMDLMSESAQELNPLIEQGSQALKDYAEDAHEMGYVLDNDAVEALARADEAQQKLLKTQEAVTKQISAEYAPYMTEALTDTADFVTKIGKALRDSGVVEKFGSILSSATDILDPLGELIEITLPALEEALSPIATLMALIADTTNLIVGLLTFNGDKIKTALGLNITSGQLSNMQQLKYGSAMSSNSYVSGVGYTGSGGYIGGDGKWHQNASGSESWMGGVTWVGENGPEPVWLPQGSRIGTNQDGRRLSGGDTYNITIPARDIREFNDIVRIAQNRRRLERMGVT